MAKKNRYEKVSTETQDEAMKMAKATQRPRQSKEQTKLIAAGIQKGIELYKKQHKEKSRELNKKMSKVKKQLTDSELNNIETVDQVRQYGNIWNAVPWVLLVVSWLGFCAIYFFGV
jgi:CRISPR/Cas system-associated endonuclease Cas1